MASSSVHLTEGATLHFIAENTSIPVPKVHCSFVRKGKAYIVMERIRGERASAAWGRLSQDGRDKILGQLSEMVREFRGWKPAPGVVGVESCVGGSLCDTRIPRRDPRFGPFKTIQEFHRWLREGFKTADYLNNPRNLSEADWRDLHDMIEMQDGEWPAPVFTHCDLSPFDLIVRDGELVGIIDWEFSGWYPCYWEYTSAWRGGVTRTAWRDAVMGALEAFPTELRMESTRCRWWGEW